MFKKKQKKINKKYNKKKNNNSKSKTFQLYSHKIIILMLKINNNKNL